MKAQVAIEFLAVSVIAIFILTAVLSTLLYNQTRATEELEDEALERIADTIQQELLLAAQVRDGYQRTFSVSQAAIDATYSIQHQPTSFTLQTTRAQTTRETPPYQGNLTPPDITVQKIAGEVVVS